MIRSLSKIFSSLALIGLIFINCVPLALAQNDFTSPLDDIKSKLEKEGIEVVDYSGEKWGKLTPRLIEELEFDYEEEGLIGMAKDEDFFAVKDLREYIEETIDPISDEEIELIINEVNLYRFSGERQIRDTVRSVAKVIRNLIGAIAIILIIISGIRMIFAQGEESIITDQKRSITYAIVGLVAILLIERMIDIIYGPAGVVRVELSTDVESAFSTEVYGLINFIRAIIASVAILFIIISGLKSITAGGEEEKITKQKRAVVWIVVGLALLAVDRTIVDNFFKIPTQQTDPELVDKIQAGNVTAIINMIGTVIQFALGFVGLIALAALIYGAGMMIANYGNDEMVQKAKKIVKSAVIGIIIIISAYTLVATLIVFK